MTAFSCSTFYSFLGAQNLVGTCANISTQTVPPPFDKRELKYMLLQQIFVTLIAVICQPLTLAFQSRPRTFSSISVQHLHLQHKKRSHLNSSFQIVDAVSSIDAFYKSSPYEAAFMTCGIKASAADFLAQKRGMKLTNTSGDEEIKSVDQIEVDRNLAFILYGGLYQGIAQYYIYNILFPLWFGQGNDLTSVAVKVTFDMLVISPFLCLPIAYLTKATIYGQSWKEGLTKYKYDFIKKNLLGKYCSIWVPAQFCTFGLIPEHLRIVFIAFISFFWLIILSTVSSAEMESEESSD